MNRLNKAKFSQNTKLYYEILIKTVKQNVKMQVVIMLQDIRKMIRIFIFLCFSTVRPAEVNYTCEINLNITFSSRQNVTERFYTCLDLPDA